MSWKTITDATVLAGLLKHRRIGVRMVCLDAMVPGADWIPLLGRGEEAWRSAPFERRFELTVMDTDPSAVIVSDPSRGEMVGAYVWVGPGGRIPSSRDDRVVQLADAIEADHRGEPSPVKTWANPEQICGDCGTKFNPAAGAPAFAVEVDQGEGQPRASFEKISSPDQYLNLVEQHCTPAQIRTFERLVLRKKHHPVHLANIRQAGGPAVQVVCPVVADRFGQEWIIGPTGAVDRMGDE